MIKQQKKLEPEQTKHLFNTLEQRFQVTEQQYYALQQIFNFDLKTSSWVETPAELRQQGGAIFCDQRYGRTFTYHNGAASYYASRGFRTYIQL